MGEQKGRGIALAHKDAIGRETEVIDALGMELRGIVHQRGDQLVDKALLGHDGRTGEEQLREGLPVAGLELQLAHRTVVFFHAEMQLLAGALVQRPLLVLLQGVAKGNAIGETWFELHHKMIFTVYLRPIEVAYRQFLATRLQLLLRIQHFLEIHTVFF